MLSDVSKLGITLSHVIMTFLNYLIISGIVSANDLLTLWFDRGRYSVTQSLTRSISLNELWAFLTICLSARTACLPAYLFLLLASVGLSVCLSVSLSVCPSVCLSICLTGLVWSCPVLSCPILSCTDVTCVQCKVFVQSMYEYVCMYVKKMYVCMHVRIYVRMYARMYVRTYVCMYVYMYVCMHIHMYVGMYVCIYAWITLWKSPAEPRRPRAHTSVFQLVFIVRVS